MTKALFSIAALASLLLCGCGYKPLNAPCAMDEGGKPARNDVQTLSFAEVERHPAPGAFASVRGNDCGLSRPINSGNIR